MTYKRLSHLLGASVLVLSLSGCIKLDLDITVKSDDTVSGTVISGLDKGVVSQIPGGEAGLREQLRDQLLAGGAPANIKVQDYSDSKFVGVRLSATDVSLAEVNKISLGGSTPLIRHEGGKFIVDTVLPFTESGFGEVPETLVDSAEIKVKITFPGKVLTHNGELSGTTVTWIGRIDQDLVLKAESEETGGAVPAGSADSNLVPILLGLGALAAVAGVGFYLYSRRRSDAMPTEWSGGSSAAGPGAEGPARTAPAAAAGPEEGATTAVVDQFDEDATPPTGQPPVSGTGDRPTGT